MSCADALSKPRADTPHGYPVLLVSAVILVDRDGRILLAQRPADKWLGGLWEFPGGKVEQGESPEFALCRELEEELGIQVRESCLLPFGFCSHAYEDKQKHLLMPVYVCRMWGGTPIAQEGQTLKWVSPKELREYNMPPADIPLIPEILDRL